MHVGKPTAPQHLEYPKICLFSLFTAFSTIPFFTAVLKFLFTPQYIAIYYKIKMISLDGFYMEPLPGCTSILKAPSGKSCFIDPVLFYV